MATVFAAVIMLPALAWQTHRVGTKGPETPPLQGAGRWHYLAPLPHARSEVGVAEANGKVYVLGGYADGFVDQPLNEEYDPAGNTWRARAPMPRGLNHVGAIGLGGKIYCIGGFVEQNHTAAPDVSVYDMGAMLDYGVEENLFTSKDALLDARRRTVTRTARSSKRIRGKSLQVVGVVRDSYLLSVADAPVHCFTHRSGRARMRRMRGWRSGSRRSARDTARFMARNRRSRPASDRDGADDDAGSAAGEYSRR